VLQTLKFTVVVCQLEFSLIIQRTDIFSIAATAEPYFPSDLSASSTSPWRPFILSPLSIVFSALLSAALVILLEMIHQSSVAHTGFSAPTYGFSIVFTYTPVVVILAVGWAWQILDVEVKKLAPWAALAHGGHSAQDSLFLDYLDANIISVLSRATRRRHFQVLATSVGGLLAAAAGVASTSLWSRVSVDSMEPAILEKIAVFNGSLFNTSIADISLFQPYLGYQLYNLSLPRWSSDNYALAPFNLSERAAKDVLITSTTDAIRGYLQCQTGTAHLASWVSVPDVSHILGDVGQELQLPQMEVTVGCSSGANVTAILNVTSYEDLALGATLQELGTHLRLD
jgi:hypothetical protein